MKKISLSIFVLITLVELAVTWFDHELGNWIAKPLLMPILLWYFYQNKPHPDYQKVVHYTCLALIFSFLGDVALLFQAAYEIAFVLGLGSFLIAHIFYILMFNQIGRLENWKFIPPWQKIISLIAGVSLVGYGFGLYNTLYPALDATLRIPVAVYALTITYMALSLLSRLGEVKRILQANIPRYLIRNIQLQLLLGVGLFILSDSCIAINQFVQPLPKAGFVIMSTYIVAQWLIIRGVEGFLLGNNT